MLSGELLPILLLFERRLSRQPLRLGLLFRELLILARQPFLELRFELVVVLFLGCERFKRRFVRLWRILLRLFCLLGLRFFGHALLLSGRLSAARWRV